ncbi:MULTISPECIES: TenA family transcriptional regulator [unclassified Leptolyngbya]|uniref:TenA family transcriptional regulator n=1 Tax=unclassified Leptolyngbya TaxID=2650499 RepID=UPI001689AFAA|nr:MULTISPECIES: TenA family transcriptional regulator [unclassified Leptolyngbya]MBD1913271.1 TenA family transcriptional regulator [Leptolyngbya sp. FACHB-8]MBD2153367.1 TenA family transcriptional regulator [Leptolyngbya sp. FACHB-16]
MRLTCQSLLDKHPQLWHDATVHPFLQDCQQGTIQPAQFNTWLVQDYIFVLECTRMAARLLSAAPPVHFDVILGGLGALKTEIVWFQDNATKRQLDLSASPQAICAEYCQYMHDLGSQPYALQAVGFWAIEAAYNQAWQGHSPMPEPYTEFGDRWGNAGFSAYVTELGRQADEALASADPSLYPRAETVFLEVSRLEKDFWQMAYQG